MRFIINWSILFVGTFVTLTSSSSPSFVVGAQLPEDSAADNRSNSGLRGLKNVFKGNGKNKDDGVAIESDGSGNNGNGNGGNGNNGNNGTSQ